MKRSRWALVAPFAVGAALALACGEDEVTSVRPVPGTLVVSLTTPNADDGAVAITVSGEGMTNVAAGSPSYAIFTRSPSPSLLKAAVVGGITGGALLSFDVPDLAKADRYHAAISEVADRGNALRGLPLTGYSVTVVPR